MGAVKAVVGVALAGTAWTLWLRRVLRRDITVGRSGEGNLSPFLSV